MSFRFRWGEDVFTPEFYAFARKEVEVALNSGPRPPNICADISIVALSFGDAPPNLELLEISELSSEKFRAMFKLEYHGNGFILIETKVQANPVPTSDNRAVPGPGQHRAASPPPTSSGSLTQSQQQRILAANKPLILPIQIRIEQLHLSGLILVSVSPSRGISLSFVNDPLQDVHVTSTFDQLPKVKEFLKKEIVDQVRHALRTDLPQALYDLSMQFMTAAAPDQPLEQPSRPDAPHRTSNVPLEQPHTPSTLHHSDDLSSRHRLSSLDPDHLPHPHIQGPFPERLSRHRYASLDTLPMLQRFPRSAYFKDPKQKIISRSGLSRTISFLGEEKPAMLCLQDEVGDDLDDLDDAQPASLSSHPMSLSGESAPVHPMSLSTGAKSPTDELDRRRTMSISEGSMRGLLAGYEMARSRLSSFSSSCMRPPTLPPAIPLSPLIISPSTPSLMTLGMMWRSPNSPLANMATAMPRPLPLYFKSQTNEAGGLRDILDIDVLDPALDDES